MQKVEITINKSDVYEEVAKTSAYIGGKSIDANGNNLYDQVFVTSEDKEMLERFWNGAIASLTYVLDSVLIQAIEDEDEGNLTMILGMTNNFKMALKDALLSTSVEYMENKIIGEWCAITDKTETEQYAGQASALLLQVSNIIHKRCRPIRNF